MGALLNGEERWREIERMKAGKGGQISAGAPWPCIVIDRELNSDRSLSDRLVEPCD